MKGRREREGKKKSGDRDRVIGTFALWTVLIQCLDVQAVGQNGTLITGESATGQEHRKLRSI